jgi:hypothetical protein
MAQTNRAEKRGNDCQSLVVGSTLIATAEVDDQAALAAGRSPKYMFLRALD